MAHENNPAVRRVLLARTQKPHQQAMSALRLMALPAQMPLLDLIAQTATRCALRVIQQVRSRSLSHDCAWNGIPTHVVRVQRNERGSPEFNTHKRITCPSTSELANWPDAPPDAHRRVARFAGVGSP